MGLVANLLHQLMGTNFKVVIGYPDSSAVQQGAAEGTVDLKERPDGDL
jgi:hypothetical protein